MNQRTRRLVHAIGRCCFSNPAATPLKTRRLALRPSDFFDNSLIKPLHSPNCPAYASQIKGVSRQNGDSNDGRNHP